MPTTFTFDCGYTGHEMLDAFGLINMPALSVAEGNGRVYDPVIARFLSPDNNVQRPDNSQGYNRYSYCFNNPLIYTDPSGNDPTIDLDTYNHWGDFSKHRNKDMDGKGGYTYNWFSKQYTYNGIATSYNSVYNNYISPNGTLLPSNINPKSVYFGKRNGRNGVWYQTTTTGPQSGTLDLRTFNVCVTNTFIPLNNNASGNNNPQSGEAEHRGETDKLTLLGYTITGAGLTNDLMANIGRLAGTGGKAFVGALENSGKAFGAAGALVIGVDALSKGKWENHHTADVTLTVIVYSISAEVPVAGWIFAGAYFITDLGFHYYTGRSITENLFDVDKAKK